MKKTTQALSLPASLILCAIFLFPLLFFGNFSAGQGETPHMIVYGSFLMLLLFLMFRSGKISRYRRIYFFSMALLFFPAFISHLILERGAMAIDSTQFITGETPFCHIVIPLTMIPMVLKQMVIFPARLGDHYASIYSMLALWIFLTLSLGRGWCSWVCFYGGWDDRFSRGVGKPKIRIDSRKPWVTHLPKAVLLFLVLGSLITLTSIYCEWFCPFKLITEYSPAENLPTMVALILMILLFFGLLIVLPILTGRRTNCGLFCPFGTMQGIIGSRVSPFKIHLDIDQCTQCGLCEKICPTFSMGKGKIRRSCTLCGECIDRCPKDALEIRIKGKVGAVKKGPKIIRELLQPRNLFILAAFTAGMIINSPFAVDSLKLFTAVFTGGTQ